MAREFRRGDSVDGREDYPIVFRTVVWDGFIACTHIFTRKKGVKREQKREHIHMIHPSSVLQREVVPILNAH
jgi:hypothetical protein